jgi:hypothetical protein
MSRPGAPPVLLDRDFGEERLWVRGDPAGRVSGQPFSDDRYGDLVADAVISLEQGGDHDGYGLFVRQANDDRYAAFIVSPLGAASVMILDQAPLQLAGGQIPESIPFERGLGARNRISVIACGPCLVACVNGVSLTGAMLDDRYTEGYAGALIVPGEPGSQPAAAVDWAQVRAVLA